jgi:hypothetical protein
MSDDNIVVVDFGERRRIRVDAKTEARMSRIKKILEWSAKMCSEGHMPEDVAQAFDEYWSGKDSDGEPI